MILIFYPETTKYRSKREDKSKRVDQLVSKVDALRTSYNYQLEALRDEYLPKISDAVDEIRELVN